MFDRYNEPARRSLFFARYEAGVLGSEAIESEHLLVGMLKQRESLLQRMIGSADLSVNDVRQRIQQRIGSHRPRVPDSTEIPFSEDAKRVIELTAEESDRLLHRHVRTEHLLLGLLRLERGLASDILREAGLSLTPVREALVMQVSATSPPTPEITGMLAGMSHGRIERTRQASAVVYSMTALNEMARVPGAARPTKMDPMPSPVSAPWISARVRGVGSRHSFDRPHLDVRHDRV